MRPSYGCAPMRHAINDALSLGTESTEKANAWPSAVDRLL